MNSKVQNAMLSLLMGYLENDPMNKIPAILDLAEKMDTGHVHANSFKVVRRELTDKNGVWYQFTENLFNEVDPRVIKKAVTSFFFNGILNNGTKQDKLREKYQCNIPWAILMDPTSACNLHCTGCWAAEYGNRNNLSFETLDSICKQGKELGIYFYLLSGGEPTVRKEDVIKLCEANPDCFFFAFTNGTLVDDKFCDEMLRVGNITLGFSIEGDEAATDMRRGKGTYQKVIAAMDRMKKHKLLFGYSTCYHRYNTESVGSDEFVDDMIAHGCRFAWNFTYIPAGKDAVTDLLATPEQREYMYHRVREIRATKPIFAMDFWNDGEYVGGCIAGGRRYLHINAAGDVEPCAFIHYSNVNIHDVTLLEALQSPLFMAYRQGQPFNENLIRPCPLLDNPQALSKMVKVSNAKSTDMEAPEDVDVLTSKTKPAAEKWAPVADELWEKHLKEKEEKEKEKIAG
ncbi:MAG TPA: radical SAM protein [Flexilinea sp.]|nr:radical SAM protein [Flexilinea sp.]